MWAQIGTFIIRAAPKAISMLLSPGKAKSLKFAATVGKLKKSKTYKAAAKFLNEDPTDWAKRNLKKSFENGDALKFLGGVASGLSDAFSSFTPKPRPMPSGANPRTSSGAAVPGAKGLSNSMANTTRAYNTSVRNLSKIAVAPPKGASKKVFDQYRASFSKRNVTLGELTSLNVQVTKKSRDGVYSLGKGIEQSPRKGSLRNIPQVMKIRPAENMKESSSKELSNYIQSTINTSTETISKDIDIVNQNLEKVMSGLAKAQSDSNKALAMNLGNFTAQNISELARIITKSEETAFRKQQESSYYQTEVLSNKMDESHRYNAASLNAVREDILANTQSMYALEQESRRIDAEYREYEERKNAGVTLPALYGLTKQVGDMVQMTFRSHSEYDQAAQNAFRSLAGDFAYELGKMAGFLKESLAAHRLIMCNFITGIEGFFQKMFGEKLGSAIAAPLTAVLKVMGKVTTMLDGFIFEKLLGIKNSVLEDTFGNVNEGCFNIIPTDKSTDEQKEQSDSTVIEQSYTPRQGKNKYLTSDGLHYAYSSIGGGAINSKGYNMYGLNETDAFIVQDQKNGNFRVFTPSGYSKEISIKRQENESEDDFKLRALNIVAGQEIDELMEYFDNKNQPGRVSKEVSRAIFMTNVSILNKAFIKYDNLNTSNQAAVDSYINVKTGFNGELEKPKTMPKRNYGILPLVTKSSLLNFCYKSDSKSSEHVKTIIMKLDAELVQRLTMAMRQAALKGIPARVTDTLRLVPENGKIISNHSYGIAVDVCVPYFEDACMQILKPKYGDKPSDVGSYSAAISWGELYSVLYKSRKGTDLTGMYKLSDKHMQALQNMFDWIEICVDFGLATGIKYYPAARRYRREREKTEESLIDLVHIQLAQVDDKFAKEMFYDNRNGNPNDLAKKYQQGETDNTQEMSSEKIIASQINSALSAINTLKSGKNTGLSESYLLGRDKGDFEIDGKKVSVNFTDGQFLNEKGELVKHGSITYNQKRRSAVLAMRELIEKTGNVKLGVMSDDELERFYDVSQGYYGEALESIMEGHYTELKKMLEELQKTRSLTDSEQVVLNLTIQAQNTRHLPSVQNDLANIDDQSKKLN